MKDSVIFGLNRTGVQMSPRLTKEMISGADEFQSPSLDTSMTTAQFKEDVIRECGPIGTVPVPGTAKGALNVGVHMLRQDHPVVLIDKLGERLAFERTGVRLYDALITKCEALMPHISLDLLYEFRREESEHFHLVWETLEKLGADPTCQTPCADVSAMASQGLVQVLNDPRTSVAQCVQSLVIAERTDNDSWELLILLAEQAGLDEEVQKFKVAKSAEEKHFLYIHRWFQQLTLNNGGVPLQ